MKKLTNYEIETQVGFADCNHVAVCKEGYDDVYMGVACSVSESIACAIRKIERAEIKVNEELAAAYITADENSICFYCGSYPCEDIKACDKFYYTTIYIKWEV